MSEGGGMFAVVSTMETMFKVLALHWQRDGLLQPEVLLSDNARLPGEVGVSAF